MCDGYGAGKWQVRTSHKDIKRPQGMLISANSFLMAGHSHRKAGGDQEVGHESARRIDTELSILEYGHGDNTIGSHDLPPCVETLHFVAPEISAQPPLIFFIVRPPKPSGPFRGSLSCLYLKYPTVGDDIDEHCSRGDVVDCWRSYITRRHSTTDSSAGTFCVQREMPLVVGAARFKEIHNCDFVVCPNYLVVAKQAVNPVDVK